MDTPSKPVRGGPVYLKLADGLNPRELVLSEATGGWTEETQEFVLSMLQSAYSAGVHDTAVHFNQAYFETTDESDWVSSILAGGVLNQEKGLQ